jgi:hypothetical protein
MHDNPRASAQRRAERFAALPVLAADRPASLAAPAACLAALPAPVAAAFAVEDAFRVADFDPALARLRCRVAAAFFAVAERSALVR